MATNNRIKNFEALKKHPMIGKWMLRLKDDDLTFCEMFLSNNQGLTDSDFVFKVNRMFLGKDDKPKQWSLISDILAASIDVQVRPRREN